MNKFFKTVSLALAFCLALPFAACGEKPDQPNPPDGGDGGGDDKKITYTGGTLADATVGVEYTATVAKATGASSITYSLKGGNLPAGLSVGADGAVSGTPTAAAENAEFTVTAAAEGYTSAEATFKITVKEASAVKPANGLDFADFTADNGMAGVYYTAMVNKASGAEGITYKVASDTTLPEGLTLLPNGFLHGLVERAGNYSFKLVASAEGKDDTTAEVSLLIRRAEEVSGNGTITKFRAKTVSDAMVNEEYLLLARDENTFATGEASNGASVSYKVAETPAGNAMPAGLTLYPNGTVYGTPTEAKSTAVVIVASAEGCPDLNARITFEIKAPKVPYQEAIKLDPATVGEAYTASVASKEAPADLTITYKVADGTRLPAGLTLAADGTLSGTPTASARAASFGVTATAEGYSPATASVSIAIKDREVTVANGRLEAEYIDLTGKSGGGYSGSANQEEMVQKDADNGASNGYYVGYTHSAGTYEFKFKASAAATGVKLEIGLGSELPDAVFTSDVFGIMVNGKEIAHDPFKPVSNGTAVGKFETFTVGNIDLVEGDNVITLVVKANTLMKGTSTGGPSIDFIQVTTSSTISWTPCLYNVARF